MADHLAERPVVVSVVGGRTPENEALNAGAAARAEERGLDYRWVPTPRFDGEQVAAALRGADVGIIDADRYDESLIAALAGRCRVLVRFGVGFDAVDLEAATRHGIAVSRTVGANAEGVAELALGFALAARRRLISHDRVVQEGAWQRSITGGLWGATVGIVGFGAVGRVLAELVRPFRCRVLVFDPFLTSEVAGVERVETLDELLAVADVVSLHVPHSPETHHLMDARRLGLMPRGAVLVNTSRGGIVDEDALAAELAAGRLEGAGLDVFSVEPLPAGSPLRGIENLILTPHIASQTIPALESIYDMAIDIAAEWNETGVVPHLLNPGVLTGHR